MPQKEIYNVALAIEAQQFQKQLESLKRSWGVFTAAIEQTQGALWNATVLGFQMSMAGRNWAENLYEIANQADVIRLKMASFEQAVKTSGQSLRDGAAAVDELSSRFQILPDQVANAMGLLLRKGFKIKDATVILQRFADSAVNVGRDIADGMEAGASALLQERSILLNSVGIAENISTSYNQYAKILHKSVQALTEAEKRQALMNLVMTSTANRVGLAQKYLAGFRGEVQRLRKEWRTFIRNFGKGIGYAFAPFISGLKALLGLLNKMPSQVSVLLGVLSTVSAMGVALAGTVFLGVSNLLRLVTTIKQTMADTIRSLRLAIDTYKASGAIITELGLASAATAKELDAMSVSFLNASAAAASPTFAGFINNIGMMATDSAVAESAVTSLANSLRTAFSFKMIGDLGAFESMKKELDSIDVLLGRDFKATLRLESAILGTIRKLSGKRFGIDELVQIHPETLKILDDVGIKAKRASRIVAAAEAGIAGDLALTKKQISALRIAIQDVKLGYANLASATAAASVEAGVSGADIIEKRVADMSRVMDMMVRGLTLKGRVGAIKAGELIDYNGLVSKMKSEFAKAGLEAELEFSGSFQAALAAGDLVTGPAFLKNVKALKVWPKGLKEAAIAERAVVIEGRELSRAITNIAKVSMQTTDSYKLAMANMAIITRSTVQGIIGMLHKLRLYSAELSLTEFISRTAPINLAKTIEGSSAGAIAAATRLGKEAGTSLAFAFTSTLQYLDVVFARVINKIKIGKLSAGIRIFGEDANAAFKYFTRGAEGAGAAAIALTESSTVLGRVLRGLNATQAASYAELGAFGKAAKALAPIILNVSNVVGFLVRAFAELVSGVPVAGWLLALLALSSKFRSAMGTLAGSVVDFFKSLVGATSAIIGAIGSLVSGFMDLTGASSLLKVAIDGIVTVISLLAAGLRFAAGMVKIFALSVRKYILEARLHIANFIKGIPIAGSVIKLDKHAMEQELSKIDEAVSHEWGRLDAENQKLKQRMIDTWGPRWSDELRHEFEKASSQFGAIENGLNRAISAGSDTSVSLLNKVNAYLDEYTSLLAKLKKGGATTQDMALIQDMISRFAKMRDSVREVADEFNKFMQSLKDKEVKVAVSLRPESLRAFGTLEQEIDKLKRDAAAKFKGADLIAAQLEIDKYGLQKRNQLVKQFNESFAKLYASNERKISDIVAKGTEDRIAQLRQEERNAIEDTKNRYAEQLKKYAHGSVQYTKLEEQRDREIYALRRYYATQLNKLTAESLRKDKQLYLNHYRDIVAGVAAANSKIFELWQKQNERMAASLDVELAKKKAAINRLVSVGSIGREEGAVDTARAERDALLRRQADERAIAKARLNSARETSKAMLAIELAEIELRRQKEVAEISASVADETRRAKLIAQANDYYARLTSQKQKSYAYDVYIAEQDYNNKIFSLRKDLLEKGAEIERLQLEKRIADNNRMAAEMSSTLSAAIDASDVASLASEIDKASRVLFILKSSGDEARTAFDSLSKTLDKAKGKLSELATGAIKDVSKQLGDMQSIIDKWDTDKLSGGYKGVAEFAARFGNSLPQIKQLLDEIGKLPDSIAGKAIGMVTPFTNALHSLSSGFDALVKKRNELAQLLATGDLSPIDARKVRGEIEQIDNAMNRYAEATARYATGLALKVRTAIRDMLASNDIDNAKRNLDMRTQELQAKALRAKVSGGDYSEVELARQKLVLATEYLNKVREAAGQMSDTNKANEAVESAEIARLQAEVGLQDKINQEIERGFEIRAKALDLESKKLDLEQAAVSRTLVEVGATRGLADTYAKLVTTQQRLSILQRRLQLARDRGDESAVVDAQEQLVSLSAEYASNLESARSGVSELAKRIVGTVAPAKSVSEYFLEIGRLSSGFGKRAVFSGMASALSQWADASLNTVNAMRNLDSVTGASVATTERYVRSLEGIAGAVWDGAEQLRSLAGSVDVVAGGFKRSSEIFSRVASEYNKMASQISRARDSVMSVWRGLTANRAASAFAEYANDIGKVAVRGTYKAFGDLSQALRNGINSIGLSVPEGAKKDITVYFEDLATRFERSKKILNDALRTGVYDPDALAKAAQDYAEIGKKLAEKTDLRPEDIIDTNLLGKVGDMLSDDEERMRAKAKHAAEQAKVTIEEYMSVLAELAKKWGTSIDHISEIIGNVGHAANPFADVSVEDVKSKGDAIIDYYYSFLNAILKYRITGNPLAGMMASIKQGVEDMVNTVNKSLASLSRTIAMKVSTSLDIRVGTLTLPPIDAASLASSVGSVVSSAIVDAASRMSINPVVNFNVEEVTSPELEEIARKVTPEVVEAVRHELDRRKAVADSGG